MYVVSLFLFYIVINVVFTQPDKTKEEKLLKLIKNEKFREGLPLALQIFETGEASSKEILKNCGIVFLNIPTERQKALKVFSELNQFYKENTAYKFYFARALHFTYDFSSAKREYQNFLKVATLTEEEKDMVKLYIKQCEVGEILYKKSLPYDIIPLGHEINTSEDEYRPVITHNGKLLLFTRLSETKKSLNEDIYFSEFTTKWTNAMPVEGRINTIFHEAALDISMDMHTLIIYVNEEGKSKIFFAKRMGYNWHNMKEEFKEATSKGWISNCSFLPDLSGILFVSDRPGGKGGHDIYVAFKDKKGNYSKVKNLPSPINTKYNETGPYLTPQGVFFYASDGIYSMGGYDILYSKVDSAWNFSPPINIGFPINTVDDEIFFRITLDLKVALFSSNRVGSIDGSYDIFAAEMSDTITNSYVCGFHLFLKKDNLPVTGEISIEECNSKKQLGPYYIDEESGETFFALKEGCYNLTLFSTYDTISTNLSLKNLKETVVFSGNFTMNDFKNFEALYKGLRKESPSAPIRNLISKAFKPQKK